MKIIFTLMALSCAYALNAQSYTETFDSNSLGWTECTFKKAAGTAVINEGVMKITSKGEKEALSALLTVASGQATQAGVATFFETHCYAPIDVLKPFKIKSMITSKRLTGDRETGLVFNYKDGGNFYCVAMTDEYVQFERWEDNRMVGQVSQNVKWDRGGKKTEQTSNEWMLESDGDVITFSVDGVPMLHIRHMPLEYSGFGYYSIGDNTTIVDSVEFIQ